MIRYQAVLRLLDFDDRALPALEDRLLRDDFFALP
jgi:hypothetical protein